MKNSSKRIILAGVFAMAVQGVLAQSASEMEAPENQVTGSAQQASHRAFPNEAHTSSYTDVISKQSRISLFHYLHNASNEAVIGLQRHNREWQLPQNTEHRGLFNFCSMQDRLRGNLLNFHRGKRHRFGVAPDKDSIIRFEVRWGGKGDHFRHDRACSNANSNGLSGALLEGVDIGRDLFELK